MCFGLRNADFSCAVEKVVGLCFPCLSLICAKMWYDAGEALNWNPGCSTLGSCGPPLCAGAGTQSLAAFKSFSACLSVP